jgi:hypothetical protein
MACFEASPPFRDHRIAHRNRVLRVPRVETLILVR